MNGSNEFDKLVRADLELKPWILKIAPQGGLNPLIH